MKHPEKQNTVLSISCDYLGQPPKLDTDIEVVYRCNAVYSCSPNPRSGKPCDKGNAIYDGFHNLCHVRKGAAPMEKIKLEVIKNAKNNE